ncbi:hypothetical protein L1049_017375 [Liquidambar formosana]|uniref:Bromo domain-containing protein n=1 Tax=Liquidambar formosana TaxID=63359 RepID=A0AAP0S0S2_LIQFO
MLAIYWEMLGMMPYPEPYQSMYQQRRLGALGIEWRPSSIKLAVGADVSLDQDYQMLPLADLDILVDPLPEFIDVMDWEPEIEVQSDDADSEYNVTEEYSSGGEQGGLSSNSSGDPECSGEDSDVENDHKDGLRRSKRKKQKAEAEIMTSSGRRVKRRNLDECDGNSFRKNRTRKSRSGRKAPRKSSTSKSLRPQRAAARNALSLFSRITGTSTDAEEEDGSEDDLSGSESTLHSNIESDESDGSLQNEKIKRAKGKEVLFDEAEDVVKPHEFHGSHMNTGNRRRLVLKLPIRDSNKPVPSDSSVFKYDLQADVVGSSSEAPEEASELNRNHLSSQDPGSSFGDTNCIRIVKREEGKPEKVEDHLDLSEGYKDGKIRWGGVKARTSKRLRLGEAMSSDANARSNLHNNAHDESENYVNGYIKPEKENGTISPRSETQNHGEKMDEMTLMKEQHFEGVNAEDLDGESDRKEHSGFNECGDNHESPKQQDHMVADDTFASSVHYNLGTDRPPEMEVPSTSISTKLRIRSTRISRDPENPSKLKIKSSVEDWRNGECDTLPECPADMDQNPVSDVPEYNGTNRTSSDHNGFQKSDAQTDKNSRSMLPDFQELHSRSNNKMYNAVYRRSKSSRARTISECNGGGMEESTSNASDSNLNAGMDFHEATIDGARRTRSMGLKATTHDLDGVNSYLKLRQGHGSEDTKKGVQSISMKRCQQIPCEEWGSSSKMAVGLRSTRNRRGSYYVRDTTSIDRRRSHQSARKQSWLLLSRHEEGSRYIPQQGDEVVYLRQGHQEYINYCQSTEAGPWRSIKGDIRAVEFCKVEGLEYAILPGSGDSCCRMTIQFVDPTSSVFRKTFKLTLPEVTSFPDFLVERTRFDAAIQRNWTCRDKCQVWWKNEGEEDGSWWEGRILSVKPKSLDFPDSPWERYVIQYKSEPTETHCHSAWELYDSNTQWEQPRIDDESRQKMLSSFAKLEQSGSKVQDSYGVQVLKDVSQNSKFVNRFPVPLSVEVIQSRLENNYYRSLEAVKHDISVMLSNAESYFEKNAEISTKMKRLSDWFTRTISSL